MFKKIILLVFVLFLTGCSLTKEKYSYVYAFGHDSSMDTDCASISNGVLILTPDKQVLQGGYIKFNHDELKRKYDDHFETTKIEITYSTNTRKENTDNTIAKFEIKAHNNQAIDLEQIYVLDKKEDNVLNGHTLDEISEGINVEIVFYDIKENKYSPGTSLMSLHEIAQIENK